MTFDTAYEGVDDPFGFQRVFVYFGCCFVEVVESVGERFGVRTPTEKGVNAFVDLKDGRTEGRKEGRKEGSKEGRKEGRKDGWKEGSEEGVKEERKEGR